MSEHLRKVDKMIKLMIVLSDLIDADRQAPADQHVLAGQIRDNAYVLRSTVAKCMEREARLTDAHHLP